MALNLWTALKKYRGKKKRLRQLEESVVLPFGKIRMRTRPMSSGIGISEWGERDTVLLKDVVRLILDHLSLDISCEVATPKKLKLRPKGKEVKF